MPFKNSGGPPDGDGTPTIVSIELLLARETVLGVGKKTVDIVEFRTNDEVAFINCVVPGGEDCIPMFVEFVPFSMEP